MTLTAAEAATTLANIAEVMARNPGQRGDASEAIDAPEVEFCSDWDGDYAANVADNIRWRTWP